MTLKKWQFSILPFRRFEKSITLPVLTASIATGTALGLVILGLSIWINSSYRFLLVFVAVFFLVGMLALGDVRKSLLVVLVLAIPLSFGFAPFDKGIPYHAGGAQPFVAIYLYDIPLMGLTVLWLAEVLVLRRPVRKSGIFLAAVLLISWSTLSIYNSVNQPLSLFEILRMIKMCILMLVVSNVVRDQSDIRAVLCALFIGLIVQSIVVAVQYTTGSNFGLGLFTVGELSRVSGTIGWPNTVGAYAAATTAIAFILFVDNPSDKIKWLSLVAGFAGFFTLIITFSRGAWGAFLIVLIAGVVISGYRKWLSSKVIYRLVLIGLAGVIVAVPFLDGILIRLAETNLEQGAIVDRFSMYDLASHMIMAHPVLGVGINTYVEVARYYDTTGIFSIVPYPVHNVYLLVAAETGLVGLGLFLALIVTIFHGFIPAIKTSDRIISSSAIGLMCGLAAILISNLADDHLRTEVLFALFWFLAGIGVALSGMAQSPRMILRIDSSAAAPP